MWTYNDTLYHHGIKGQKWGVRRYQNPDGTLTSAGKRRAKKDAKEFARAKMFYGEGAGNRRKLIKSTVEERSKDPEYKKAFDKYLSEQDMAVHASRAKAERKAKDAKNSAIKTGKGVVNIVTGHPERLSAGMAVAAAAAGVLHKTKVDKVIINAGKNKFNQIVDDIKTERGRREVEKMFKKE